MSRDVAAQLAIRSAFGVEGVAAVRADLDELQRLGIEPTTLWTDEAAGTVVIGLASPTPEVVAVLVERYGPRIQVIEHGGFDQAP